MADVPPSYSVGTATVNANSLTATGQGTAWLTSGPGPGDIFWAAGLSVRVLSVDSNTKLTFAYPWPGASRTADSYEIRYTPQQSRTFTKTAAVLDALTNGNISSVASLTTAADKLAYYTGVGVAALTNFTAFARSLLAGTNAAAMRTTLGLAPVAASGSAADLTGLLPDAQLPNRLKPLMTAPASMDDVRETGFYRSTTNTTGRPLSTDGVYIHIQQDALWGYQRWMRMNNKDIYERRLVAGVWEAWEKSYNTNAELDARVAAFIQICTPGVAFDNGDTPNTTWGQFFANGVLTSPVDQIGSIGGAISFSGQNTSRRRASIAAIQTGIVTQYGVAIYGRTATSVTTNTVQMVGGFTHASQFYLGADPTDILINQSKHFINRAYTVATLPAASAHTNCIVIATNGRAFNGAGVLEAAGAGTGVAVQSNGSAWKIVGTNITVSA